MRGCRGAADRCRPGGDAAREGRWALDLAGRRPLRHCRVRRRVGADMGEPQEAGAAASPLKEWSAERRDRILTPDQRLWVFISSTLVELAPERAASRRAIA